MTQFIEVHDAEDNKPMLLNPAYIAKVSDAGEDRCWIERKDEVGVLLVSESYQQIKELLSMSLA